MTLNDYFQLLTMLCPDFSYDIIGKTARLMAIAPTEQLKFQDASMAVHVVFFYEEFFEAALELNQAEVVEPKSMLLEIQSAFYVSRGGTSHTTSDSAVVPSFPVPPFFILENVWGALAVSEEEEKCSGNRGSHTGKKQAAVASDNAVEKKISPVGRSSISPTTLPRRKLLAHLLRSLHLSRILDSDPESCRAALEWRARHEYALAAVPRAGLRLTLRSRKISKKAMSAANASSVVNSKKKARSLTRSRRDKKERRNRRSGSGNGISSAAHGLGNSASNALRSSAVLADGGASTEKK
jgi:hypothetical protein